MSIVDFIAVVSFGLTYFGLGYTFGKDDNKPQKQPLWSGKLSGNFCQNIYRTNRLSVALFFYNHISTHVRKCQNFFILHSAAFFASIIFQFSFFKKGDMLIQDHSKGGELIQ